MLFTRRPDGSLLIEVNGKQFTEMWKAAPQADRIVMDDRRPAVRTHSDVQRHIHAEVQDQWKRTGKIRKIYGKSRQVGSSILPLHKAGVIRLLCFYHFVGINNMILC